MSKKTDEKVTREAVKSIRSGAIVLLTDANREVMLRKNDMVPTIAVQGESGGWVDANDRDGKSVVAGSTDLHRLQGALVDCNRRREHLVNAIRNLPGGDKLLEAMGLADAVPEQTAPLMDLPSNDVDVRQTVAKPESATTPVKKTSKGAIKDDRLRAGRDRGAVDAAPADTDKASDDL